MSKGSGKKGEVSSAQIIALVLAIAGFLIVLAFIYGFQGTATTNDDVCKLSVVGRATAQEIVGGAGQYVPLKCTTKKICITDSLLGGSCSQFAGEKDVQTVRLSGSPADKTAKIEEITANAMYDCWNMMGQGKLDLVSTYGTQLGWSSGKSTCVICSRVALSDKIDPQIVNSIDMNTYLSTQQVPGSSLTYLQAFTDAGINAFPTVNLNALTSNSASSSSGSSISDLQAKVAKAQTDLDAAKTDAEKKTAQDALNDAQSKLADALSSQFLASSNLDGQIDKNQIALVFMQIKSISFSKALQNQITLGAVAAGSSFAIAPKPTVAIASKLFSAGGLVVTLGAAAVDLVTTGLNTYAGQKAAVGYCGSFTSADKSASGCSLVQVMPYSFKDISQLCQVIQGSP